MEIHELRIGNYVKYKEEVYSVQSIVSPRPVGGKRLLAEDVVGIIKDNGDREVVVLDELEPILIEENHLIELGFENTDVWWDTISIRLLEQEDNKGNEYLIIEGLEDSPEIKYVHHLQNILTDLS